MSRLRSTLQTLAALGLSPLLLWQARDVRKSTPLLAEPAGEREGQNAASASLRVLIAGDSSAAGVGADTQSEALCGSLIKALGATHTLKWRLIAKCGWKIADLIKALTEETAEYFDVVVLAVGVNHVTSWDCAEKWTESLEQLTLIISTKFQARHIVFSSVPPMGAFPALPHPLRFFLGLRANLLDQSLQRFIARKMDCHYVPFNSCLRVEHMAADGFHPGPAIYHHWGSDLALKINDLMKSRSPSS